MLVELANQAARDGHRVTACVTRTEISLAEKLDLRVELMILGRQRRVDPLPLLRFARWIRRNKVDVLHAHGRSSFSLCATLRAFQFVGTPIILHDHYGVDIDPTVPRWFPLFQRYCDAYVGVYASHRNWALRAAIPESRIRVIGNAFSAETLVAISRFARGPLSEGRSSLISIGGIRREKAIDVLLEAVALLKRDVELVVVGGDADVEYANACRRRAHRSDLVGRVTFLGSRQDALALATNASLAVHSSRAESGPLVLAEYAVLGVPFVSTRVGGIARELESAGIGRFVDAGNATELASAIEEMLALDPGQRAKTARSRSQDARRMFDITTVMPRWYTLYSELLQ